MFGVKTKMQHLFSSGRTYTLTEIRLFTATISLLFSIIAFAADDLINSDGVLYMNMARAMLEGGLAASAVMYDWPFFSALVAGLHWLTGLPLETSGNLINILFFVIFTDALILICAKLLPNPQHLFIAALLILGFTLFNFYRAYLFRDLGYWAFMALALFQFIRVLEAPSWQRALVWQALMIVAILFRVEGIVFMALLPIYALFHPRLSKQSFYGFLQLYSVGITTLFVALLAAVYFDRMADAFGKIQEVLLYADLESTLGRFTSISDAIAEQALNQYSERYAGLILASGLLVMMLEKFITALSWPYLALLALAWWAHRNGRLHVVKLEKQGLIVAFVAINFVILTTFVFTKYFLSTRYSVMLVTGLFILLLPIFCQYISNAWREQHKAQLAFIGLMILAGPIDTFTSSVSKAYIKETALWAAKNLPENSTTFTQDIHVDFYMRENGTQSHVIIDRESDLGLKPDTDFLIFIAKRRDSEMIGVIKEYSENILYESRNSRGDKGFVFKLKDTHEN